jgi:hypothetical protein
MHHLIVKRVVALMVILFWLAILLFSVIVGPAASWSF